MSHYEVLGDRVLREIADTYGGTNIVGEEGAPATPPPALRPAPSPGPLARVTSTASSFLRRVHNEGMTKRLGLPTYVWAGVAYVGYRYWKSRRRGSYYGYGY